MARVKVIIPGFGESDADGPIVILGPNGSGKTQLAQKIAGDNQVSAISAQRRTWVDESLPVQQDQQLLQQVESQQQRWRRDSWHPTEEMNFVLSKLIQDHASLLTERNEQAIEAGVPFEPVKDTNLIRLQTLWNRLFPKRKLEFVDFFPKVKRLDAPQPEPAYQLRQMSDGERTVLYMAARVLTAERPIILVDEPELHMHSRLAVQFWDEAERLRPDRRFVYVTHDLSFSLSRRNATYLLARSRDAAEPLAVDQLPSSVAAEVLGAATLPFYAKRIFFFEGEPGRGTASELFAAWFDDSETFAVPAGNRDAVSSAVVGLRAVGVVGAEVLGLVDRDYYSDAALGAVSSGVQVLRLHEIESVLCDRRLVQALAGHQGKDPDSVWSAFLERVRNEYRGQTLSSVVARRVRARAADLLEGAFSGAQIAPDVSQTRDNHIAALRALDFPTKAEALFEEEAARVSAALDDGGAKMLAILPGKHLLRLLADVLGFSNVSELTGIVVRSLDRQQAKPGEPLFLLGEKVEAALLDYLPPRRAQPTRPPSP